MVFYLTWHRFTHPAAHPVCTHSSLTPRETKSSADSPSLISSSSASALFTPATFSAATIGLRRCCCSCCRRRRPRGHARGRGTRRQGRHETSQGAGGAGGARDVGVGGRRQRSLRGGWHARARLRCARLRPLRTSRGPPMCGVWGPCVASGALILDILRARGCGWRRAGRAPRGLQGAGCLWMSLAAGGGRGRAWAHRAPQRRMGASFSSRVAQPARRRATPRAGSLSGCREAETGGWLRRLGSLAVFQGLCLRPAALHAGHNVSLM